MIHLTRWSAVWDFWLPSTAMLHPQGRFDLRRFQSQGDFAASTKVWKVRIFTKKSFEKQSDLKSSLKSAAAKNYQNIGWDLFLLDTFATNWKQETCFFVMFLLKRFARRMFGVYFFSGLYTLQETNISPKNGILKMIFLFPRWDMLIPWRLYIYIFLYLWTLSCFRSNWGREIRTPFQGLLSAWKKTYSIWPDGWKMSFFQSWGAIYVRRTFAGFVSGILKKLVPLEKLLRRRTLLP